METWQHGDIDKWGYGETHTCYLGVIETLQRYLPPIRGVTPCSLQYTKLQYNAVQCSVGQYTKVQCSAVQRSVGQYSAVQSSTV